MGDKEIDPTKYMSPYSGFLNDKLNKIYDAWDQGDEVRALDRAQKLYHFLQRDMKKALSPKMAVINEKLNKAASVTGVDWFTGNLNQNKQLRRVAIRFLPAFVDELVGLLDDKGFLGEVKRKVPEGHE